LEEPKNGSFISSLQLFVAWVKSQIDWPRRLVL
jgi:hypothetical protein